MKSVKQRGIDEYVQATPQIEALGSKDDSFYVEKGAFWQTITIKYHSKNTCYPPPHANGLTMRTPSMICPSFMSSVSNVSQRAASAVLIISES